MQPVPSPAAPPSGHRRPCQPIILLPLVAGGLQPIIFPSTTTPPLPAPHPFLPPPVGSGPHQPIIFPSLLRLFQPIILSLSLKASPSHNTARRLTCGPNPSQFHTSRLCQRRWSPSLSLPPPSSALSLPGSLPPSCPRPLSQPHPVPARALTSPPASSLALSPLLGSSSHAPSPLPFRHFSTHSSVCGMDIRPSGERVPPEGNRPVTAPENCLLDLAPWKLAQPASLTHPLALVLIAGRAVWVRIHLEALAVFHKHSPWASQTDFTSSISSPHSC